MTDRTPDDILPSYPIPILPDFRSIDPSPDP